MAPGETGRGWSTALRSFLHRLWEKLAEETAEASEGGWFDSRDPGSASNDEKLHVRRGPHQGTSSTWGGALVASRETRMRLRYCCRRGSPSFGLLDELLSRRSAYVVVLKEDVEPDALIEFAKQHLAAYKVPKSVHIVDELPKNASGKLLKRELRRAFGGSESAVAASRSQTTT